MTQQGLFDGMQSEEFLRSLKAGEKLKCPCCRRYAQVYKRRIHASIAAQLIKLYRLGGKEDYFHVATIMLKGASSISDFTQAEHWGLITTKENDDESKPASGYWKLTKRGVDFVLGRIKVREIMLTFDAKVVGEEGGEVTIIEALAQKFNYSELMAA